MTNSAEKTIAFLEQLIKLDHVNVGFVAAECLSEVKWLVEELNDKDTVPRSRYNACNADWLEAKRQREEIFQNAKREIERLEAERDALVEERDRVKEELELERRI